MAILNAVQTRWHKFSASPRPVSSIDVTVFDHDEGALLSGLSFLWAFSVKPIVMPASDSTSLLMR